MLNDSEEKGLYELFENLSEQFIDSLKKLKNPSLSEVTKMKEYFVHELEEQFFAYKVNEGY